MRITVLRAFLIGGARQEPGSELEVSDVAGRELIQMGKAAAVGLKVDAAKVMTTQSAGELVSGKAAKPAPDSTDGKTPQGKGGKDAA